MPEIAPTVSLYVRGEQSIHIVRSAFRLRVFGPDATEHTHEFSDIAAMVEFLRWYAAALTSDGWVLHPEGDRRVQEDELPVMGNRRRSGAWLVH